MVEPTKSLIPGGRHSLTGSLGLSPATCRVDFRKDKRRSEKALLCAGRGNRMPVRAGHPQRTGLDLRERMLPLPCLWTHHAPGRRPGNVTDRRLLAALPSLLQGREQNWRQHSRRRTGSVSKGTGHLRSCAERPRAPTTGAPPAPAHLHQHIKTF